MQRPGVAADIRRPVAQDGLTVAVTGPTGDLGIRNAIRKAYGLKDAPTPAEMEALAGKWRPYCSVASWYLWRSLESDANM